MIYVQFYQKDLAGNLAEACGDRSVVILDARLKRETLHEISAQECKRRGYLAWALFLGESFMRSEQINGPVFAEGWDG